MEELLWIFTLVAQVIIVCGGIAFLFCFYVGAKLLYDMFRLSVFTMKSIHKWGNYKKIPAEGREEADKSGHFNDETKDIK